MRLHDRYLFRELLTPLAVCLGAFLIFWLSIFFTQETGHMREAKLHFIDTFEYAIAMTPGFLAQLLPFLLLFAMLRALTQHARHNEITALRSAGVSLWRLCLPYFVVGFLAVIVSFVLNEIVVPACNHWSEIILTRYVKNTNDPRLKTRFTNVGFRNGLAQRIWKIDEYDSITTAMLNPNVIWTLPDGAQRGLVAERGVHTNGVWVFFNVKQFSRASTNSSFIQLPTTNALALTEFDETPKYIYLEIRFNNLQGMFSARTADIPVFDLWPYLRQNPDLSGHEAATLWTKFHGRLAAPWTCFIVVLMAIPFGAQSGRRNVFYGVAGSIFICFGFFVLQQVCLALGMGGNLEPWLAAWLPNIIFGVVGFILTLRVR